MLTLDEIADELGVTTQTIKTWQRRGVITGRRVDGRRAHLYHPGQTRPLDRRFRQPATPDTVTATRDDETYLAPQTITPAFSTGGAV
jgi:hypothetical protein